MVHGQLRGPIDVAAENCNCFLFFSAHCGFEELAMLARNLLVDVTILDEASTVPFSLHDEDLTKSKQPW